MMVIYVDDFIMAAPTQHQAKLWADIRKELTLDDPEDPGRFLGCYLRRFTCKAKDVATVLQNNPELYPRQKPGEKKT